jgi:hypothetical protein
MAAGAGVAAVGAAPQFARVGPNPHRTSSPLTAPQIALTQRQLDQAAAGIQAARTHAAQVEASAQQLQIQNERQAGGG